MNPKNPTSKIEEITSPAYQFDEIALLYDALMAGVPYAAWIDYIHSILDEFGVQPKTVLDLCCGTGSGSLLLAKRGYKVTGVDISPEMIDVAMHKAEESGAPINFYAQDASRLHVSGKFDLVVSLFDSLNYILDPSALSQAFQRVSKYLNPSGLFIFDMNTEYALAAGFFDQDNIGSKAHVHYKWHSNYDLATRICSIDMDFVHHHVSGDRKIHIMHHQRAYDIEEIVGMLIESGVQVLAVYKAYTFQTASPSCDRVFFVARK